MVAKALLGKIVCNPIFFVDEFDKPAANSWNSDPYRPFYTLLERDTAASFFDEYLRVPLRADFISWIFAANSIETIPEPIRNRLTIVPVEDPTVAQRKAIVRSVYAEKNRFYNGFFAAEPDEALVEILAHRNLRELKRAFDRAMGRAAAQGRDFLTACDLPPAEERSNRIGFVP